MAPRGPGDPQWAQPRVLNRRRIVPVFAESSPAGGQPSATAGAQGEAPRFRVQPPHGHSPGRGRMRGWGPDCPVGGLPGPAFAPRHESPTIYCSEGDPQSRIPGLTHAREGGGVCARVCARPVRVSRVSACVWQRMSVCVCVMRVRVLGGTSGEPHLLSQTVRFPTSQLGAPSGHLSAPSSGVPRASPGRAHWPQVQEASGPAPAQTAWSRKALVTQDGADGRQSPSVSGAVR